MTDEARAVTVTDHTWTCYAHPLRVVDGDTFDADLDLGHGLWNRGIPGRRPRIRLLGINAPEKREEGGEAAGAFLARMILAERYPHGLHTTTYGWDSFGRVLAVVRSGPSPYDSSLAAELVVRGHAEYVRYGRMHPDDVALAMNHDAAIDAHLLRLKREGR